MSVDFENLLCPLAIDGDKITLGHGAGGALTAQLVEREIIKPLLNPHLKVLQDSAVLPIGSGRIAYTTDSYVVKPIFFPGGDIGALSVIGTVNDLSMMGAKPLFLSLSLIIEEGFPIAHLRKIITSIKHAADQTQVEIVTGDTKVVDAGKGDGIFINTSGIGIIEGPRQPGIAQIKTDDVVIVSGDIGRHGCAVMAGRQGIEMETELLSDMAPLHEPVLQLFDAGIDVHCLRDLTRGGLATCAIEIAEAAQLQMTLSESAIPVSKPVQALCNVLGLEALYVANEGRMLLIIPGRDAQRALTILKRYEIGKDAAIIGKVENIGPTQATPAGERDNIAINSDRGRVILTTAFGTQRQLDKLSGEQLPRIC